MRQILIKQLAFSLLLVLIGHFFILQRIADGPTEYLSIRGDSISYIAMAEGDQNQVKAPFKYRILVPSIAALLPWSAADSLKAISYICLFISYLAIMMCCSRLGSGMVLSSCALFGAFSSKWHLINYHNPFLTDAFGLMILTLMLLAFIRNSFWLFALISIVGILARETTIFLVPVWALKDLRKGLILSIISTIVLFVPRILISSDATTSASILEAFFDFGIARLCSPVTFCKSIFLSLGFSWIFLFSGLWLIKSNYFIDLSFAFLALLAGAFLTCLIANDIGRMFASLMPVAVIAYVHVIMKLRLSMQIQLLILWSAQMLFSLPNAFLGEQFFAQGKWPWLIVQAVGAVWSLWVVFSLRKEILGAYIEKKILFYNQLRKYIPLGAG